MTYVYLSHNLDTINTKIFTAINENLNFLLIINS
jgi:hypothetical protein